MAIISWLYQLVIGKCFKKTFSFLLCFGSICESDMKSVCSVRLVCRMDPSFRFQCSIILPNFSVVWVFLSNPVSDEHVSQTALLYMICLFYLGLNVSLNVGHQEGSNLLRMRNSCLGKSAPLLSPSVVGTFSDFTSVHLCKSKG